MSGAQKGSLVMNKESSKLFLTMNRRNEILSLQSRGNTNDLPIQHSPGGSERGTRPQASQIRVQLTTIQLLTRVWPMSRRGGAQLNAAQLLGWEAVMRCDQCEALMIQGVFCHETGCPNFHKRYDSESDCWVRVRTCRECGCVVDADEVCCE